MPGYVNYWLKEDQDKLSAHTKEEFKKYNILTVYGIIFMNALQISPFSLLFAQCPYPYAT